ncbi:Glutamyl-tRNA(Gln) amidotransferase subunit C [Tepidimonas alkaliphilus]|uniref:Aspartyl/glutamyl-tRNA(Asn/Gln) amidotransferase subunit C n=1 Tax=Tepidimonas alkaliphilus TaxID=2588942 RepID=A0A554W523_9BURK|nr:Asp-tRNA(Asn)/Glu-tRNA(Gln) amidotransferase subunit GatC [Tepidimonas alkaliphilus]TSE18669.1 Glutamyl-tRNA(Gln) amidotransferase subunit C [Tepidimonas alkaliphilus]
MFTIDDVQRLARLARLALDPPAAERMRGQLDAVLALVERLRAVDTTGVEPLAHPAELFSEVALRLRDDEVREPPQREAILANAPATEAGLFLVPKVIE